VVAGDASVGSGESTWVAAGDSDTLRVADDDPSRFTGADRGVPSDHRKLVIA